MKKLILACFSILAVAISYSQTLQSPEQFLGYKVGTQYTPHYKIVNYFNAVASASKSMIKLQQYGQTNEGRPLLLAIISSVENMQQLEGIQSNNLRLAGLTKDKAAPQTNNAPAIVWLSYNVHGNEPSSSEAAMLTLFALLDPNNNQTKEWLKNTVVIIDPCLNPDGRDRYVNWYTQMVGNKFNADPQTREHNEPWPGGRSNHYNFDLNRDWAWQTQVETQQRIFQYNLWMPQVHVDFHEQYFDNPYYFAPAAEPFHEVITPWQREFQTTIGRNNAKYFDAKGWLYFTRQQFDLFYPSYGDTYPLYNGSIGMTYEQGGHSRGGLAVTKSDGDTLTLVDRATHHFTTGLSTIEAASKNAQQLVTEFKKFFDDAKAGKVGEYKTYILTSDDENKIAAVKKLLEQNKIEYGKLVTTTSVKGFNYQSLKEEEVKQAKYAIAVSAYQSKAALVQVLLEPKNKLSDSATYDITAWSIPYAYGLDAYAIKDKKEITIQSVVAESKEVKPSLISTYGYLINYTFINSAKCVAYLLSKGIKVRYAEKPFTYKSKQYERGTLIIIKTGNNLAQINTVINEAAQLYNIQPEFVETGFMDKGSDFGSSDVKLINTPKVAMLTSDGVSSTAAGEVWNFFEQQLKYPLALFHANDFGRINLKNYNTLILPDGYYRSLNDKAVQDKLKDFVKGGGKLIALEGAVNQLASGDWGIKSKEDKTDDKASGDYSGLKKYADRERDFLPNSIPGAIYKVELDNTHPLAFGYGNNYYTLKQDANIYEFLKEGWNVGVLKKENYVTGFSGFKVKNKLKDGTVLGVNEIGGGSFIFFAEDPLFRLFWENGKLLFCNAVFMVGN
jgi:murein tripeptide amidase MpaA